MPFATFTWLPAIPALKALSSMVDNVSVLLVGSADSGIMSKLPPVISSAMFCYFSVMALAVRFDMFANKSSFTPEEILLAMFSAFTFSRETTRVDMAPVMTFFGSLLKRYDKSIKVLDDMLPEHIVDSLIRAPTSEPHSLDHLRRGVPLASRASITSSRAASIGSPLQLSCKSLPSDVGPLKINRLKSQLGQPSMSDAAEAQQGDVFSRHECCTIFFSDLVGFSTWANKTEPETIMSTLHNLYTRLDDLIINELPQLYKIETIGDAFVCAANLIDPDPMHALHAIRFALRAQEEASKVPRPDIDGEFLQMRIGLHSGSVVSGVIGKIRKRFCLFGDAVNMTARTESSCPPGCVQLTEACYNEAKAYLEGQSSSSDGSATWQDIEVFDRGLVQVKGSEHPLHMYLATWKGGRKTYEAFMDYNQSVDKGDYVYQI